MDNIFAYIDDEDRCYGLTGMVISLEVLDEEHKLLQVTLDEGDGEPLSFTPDFFFFGNPRFSAKIAWNEMLKQFQVMTGMIISNVLCRYSLHRRCRIDQNMVQALHNYIMQDGHDMCSLEDDEIDMLFEKTLRYMMNVYNDGRIQRLASRFAGTLLQRRTLSAAEISDLINS